MDDSPDPVFALAEVTGTHDRRPLVCISGRQVNVLRGAGLTPGKEDSLAGLVGEEEATVHRGSKVSWQLIGVLILVLLFVVVVLQNTEVVRIQLLFWVLSMSRIILLCFALLVGFAVGYWVARREKGRKKPYLIRRAKGDSS